MITRHSIIIIGAGFAGIGLALRLKQSGIDDFHIIEAESGIGGTWWLNRYPGSACDVQSHLYSLSFAPNPDWSRQFPSRTEIQTHLEHVAKDAGLMAHITLNTRLTEARWDEQAQQWTLTTDDGHDWACTTLISAMGGLARPADPDIAGIQTFKGLRIHTQRWPDHTNFSGQRVGVIGTGASAVQLIPHLAKDVSELVVFQRTPNWVLPKPDRAIPTWRRKAYRFFPPFRYLTRLGLFLLLETRLPAFIHWPKLSFFHKRRAIAHLQSQVADPTLVEKLTPHYQMGCKRVLMSNDYYPAFGFKHVTLVTDPIMQVTDRGITTQHGQCFDLDVLVLATGFEATSPIPKGLILSSEGKDLAEAWSEGPEAYKGLSVHGFPNFFMLLGPNTALGHNSVLLMIEGQIRYIIDAIKSIRKNRWRRIEVSLSSQQRWNRFLDRTLAQSVWSQGGCQSWYLHPKSRRNTTLWPHTTIRFKWLTRRFDRAAYHIE